MMHKLKKSLALLAYLAAFAALLFLVVHHLSGEVNENSFLREVTPGVIDQPCGKIQMLNAGQYAPCSGAMVPFAFLLDCSIMKDQIPMLNQSWQAQVKLLEAHNVAQDRLCQDKMMNALALALKPPSESIWRQIWGVLKYGVSFAVGFGAGAWVYSLTR